MVKSKGAIILSLFLPKIYTGSYPESPQGWHFNIRFKDSEIPFRTPCLFIDSIEYEEHVGSNLHDFPTRGDNNNW